ncbi:MAG: GNAT family N-acetyltransferase [Hyphomicrobiaceae bacterium]
MKNSASRDLVIRRARPTDVAEIAAMSSAFRRARNEPPDFLNAEAVLRDGFGPHPEFEIFLAVANGEISGYALFYNAYETAYAARGLYLSDLFVKDAARRRGIGRALVAAVTAESRRRSRTFVWWVALAENGEAHAFYRSLRVNRADVIAYAATPFDAFESLGDEALAIDD